MNPDHFDPKSHVPSVHPGDDWGDLDQDLDQVSGIPQKALQPGRPDRGIPTKRELNPVTAKRHAPYPKLCDDEPVPSTEPISIGATERKKPATKAARKTAKKAAKKAPKTVAKRGAKKKAADKSEDISGAAPPDSPEAPAPRAKPATAVGPYANEKDIPIPLPNTVERGSKRFRVNEIAPQRPAENRTQKAPLTLTKGKWASNEELMQSGNIQSAEALSQGVTNLRATMAWIIGAGAAVILIVAVAILLTRPDKVGPEVKKISDFSELNLEKTEEADESKEVKSIDALINGEDQAKKVFTKYATSKTVDDFIEVIYSPDKNRDLVSRIWKSMDVEPGWKPGENCSWTVTEYEGAQFGILTGVLPDYSGFRAVFRQEGDVLKMDWRATTGHSSAAYSELKQGQGDASEIRAILTPGDFHTFTLPEGEFRCYRLTAPDRDENIWAYIKINGAIDTALASQFIPSQLTGEAASEVPVVLGLTRGPAQSLPNQWMISKVVRMNWLDE